MRLRQTLQILKETASQIEIKGEETTRGTFKVSGSHKALLKILPRVATVTALERFVQEVIARPLFHALTDSVEVSHKDWEALRSDVRTLRFAADLLMSTVEVALANNPENTVSFKFPKTERLSELSNYIETLDKVLNQSLVNEDLKGDIRVKGFDTGSEWLEILLGSSQAVVALQTIAWSSIKIAQEWSKLKKLEMETESFGIDLDTKRKITEQATKKIDDHLTTEAERIKLVLRKEADGQYIAQLKFAIKELAGMIEKGAELRLSYESKDPSLKDFPDFDVPLEKLEQPQKLLQKLDDEKGT